MTHAPTALAALSLAIRERLLGGGAAVLPGLGTLSRAHVPARVEARPDGSRALLPPSETVRLSAPEGDPTPLAALVVRHLGAPQADPAAALQTVLDHLEARLAATGVAPLAGLGAFERTSGGVRFLPDPALLATFGRPLTGVPAVSQPPPAPPPPPSDALVDLPPAAGVLGVPVESAADGPAEGREAPDGLPTGDPMSDATASPPNADAQPVLNPEPPADPSPEGLQPVRPLPTPALVADETPRPVPSAMPDETPSAPQVDEEPRPEPWADDSPPDDSPPDDGVWTAPDPLPPPSLGDDDPIEDADFQIVEPAPLDAAAFVPTFEIIEPDAGDDAGPHSPLVETVFPPSGAPVPDPPPVVAPTSPVLPEPALGSEDSSPSVARWLVPLVVIAVLAGIASYWWVYLRGAERQPAAAGASVSTEAAPSAPAPAVPAVPDTMAAPLLYESPGGVSAPANPSADGVLASDSRADAPEAPRPALPSRVATPQAVSPAPAAPRAAGRAPDAGQALLPPRLAGLPGSDATALASASAVDPARGGFTWVVLSTPSAADAEALAARYRLSGYRTGVVQTAGARAMWRVVVGQFESREHALRLRDRLPPQAPPDTWPLPLSR